MHRDVWQFGSTLALFAASAFAWIGYLSWRGKAEWVRGHQKLVAFIGGAGAAFLSLALFGALSSLGVEIDWSDLGHASRAHAAQSALIIGIIEEASKLMFVSIIFYVTTRRVGARADGELKSQLGMRDGLVLAACVGVGFAAAEGVVLTWNGALSSVEELARAAASPLTHALFVAPCGVCLALARPRPALLLGGFFTSATAHAVYNFCIARPDVPRAFGLAVVVALWVWLIVNTSTGLASTSSRAAPLRLS